MVRFKTEVLTQTGNLDALTDLSGRWIDGLRGTGWSSEVVLDRDISVSEFDDADDSPVYPRYPEGCPMQAWSCGCTPSRTTRAPLLLDASVPWLP